MAGGNVTTIEGDPEGNIRDHKRRQDCVLGRANVACVFELGLQLCASAYETMAIPVESRLWTLARLAGTVENNALAEGPSGEDDVVRSRPSSADCLQLNIA